LKRFLAFIAVFVAMSSSVVAAEKELEIQGKRLISRMPPFTLNMPAELRLAHSSTAEYPKENSRTRAYFFVSEKSGQVEQMVIVQIADRTNPEAELISAPPLKPDTEKGLYAKGKLTREKVGVDYLIQLIAWIPDSPSLQPIVKKGFRIPSHLAIQGQFMLIYGGENAVFLRYSKDVGSFGMKVSGKGADWNRELISGNEKKVQEVFQKDFMKMIDSLTFKTP